jgi:hypothetical protein
MPAGAGFDKIPEFGEDAGAEKEQEGQEVPEDGKKVEAVAGTGVGDGFLVFIG